VADGVHGKRLCGMHGNVWCAPVLPSHRPSLQPRALSVAWCFWSRRQRIARAAERRPNAIRYKPVPRRRSMPRTSPVYDVRERAAKTHGQCARRDVRPCALPVPPVAQTASRHLQLRGSTQPPCRTRVAVRRRSAASPRWCNVRRYSAPAAQQRRPRHGVASVSHQQIRAFDACACRTVSASSRCRTSPQRGVASRATLPAMPRSAVAEAACLSQRSR